MAMSDYTSGINHALRTGEQRGIAIGEQKTQAKYVLKLSQKGMSIEAIAEWTDLPPEEVTGILKLPEALLRTKIQYRKKKYRGM
ncbi:MAG: hypothetical protein LBM08_13510 [Dysgonamonadaceae bacterium]|jgi:predicted transposase YdaD|nr:hypothetical protein [Dysgonamonadaceae bacterium]